VDSHSSAALPLLNKALNKVGGQVIPLSAIAGTGSSTASLCNLCNSLSNLTELNSPEAMHPEILSALSVVIPVPSDGEPKRSAMSKAYQSVLPYSSALNFYTRPPAANADRRERLFSLVLGIYY